MSFMNIKDAPKDAVRVNENEAVQSQWDIISNWNKKTEVWALLFGPFINATACGLTGFYINTYYRKKVKIGRYGHFTSYLPMVILPTLFSGLFHFQYVTASIITRRDVCEVCTEVKAMALQSSVGLGYTLTLGPIISYFLASQLNTCRIPIINREPKKMWEFHKITSRRLYTGPLTYLLAMNVITASVMTYFEFKNFYSLEAKLAQIEKDLIAKGIIFE